MRSLALALVFTVSGMISIQAMAHTAEKPAASESEAMTPEMLMYSVVKINNLVADVFSPDPGSSHGSGFFVGVDAETKKGLIFTNRHVIETSPAHAQQLTVEFNTDDVVGEKVPARLLYVSNLHDFAVLEFDPSKLERAKLNVPLHLPTKESPFLDFVDNARRLRGSPVLAIGNPFDGENVFTYGEITGLQMRDMEGPFIQTQTPINPGNSGGPLISRDTGEVVGINTSIYQGANSVGYATPIGPLMREFAMWRQQVAQNLADKKNRPTAADSRVMTFSAGAVSAEAIKVLGQYDAVTAAVPDFWRRHQTILMIKDVLIPDGLEKDDILIRMDGEVVGGYPYNLFKRLQHAGEVVAMEVLRKGKSIVVKVPFAGASYDSKKLMVDYVYISGLLIKDMPRSAVNRVLPGVTSRVSVAGSVDSAETKVMGAAYPPPGSLIVAVNFGGEDYKVETLLDLKLAVNQNRDKPWVKLRVYRSNGLRTDAGVQRLISPMTGMPLLDGTLQTVVVPMREVLTPMQFSIHQFKKQFSFDPSMAHTWDWRERRHPERLPSTCANALIAPKGT